MLVQKSADFFLLKTFAFHDMAPVAGRIADAQKDRFVFRPCPGKGLVIPGEPVNRIVRVLEQIRGFFLREPVGVFVGGGHDGINIQVPDSKLQRNLIVAQFASDSLSMNLDFNWM
jgi:hypothetical protein